MSSTFKQLGKAYDQMERLAHQRAVREAKEEKLREKAQEKANATSSVEHYNKFLSNLVSLHKEESEKVDWEGIRSETSPSEPVPGDRQEKAASLKLTNYQPSLIDKLFSLRKKRIASLEKKLALARQKDRADYEKARTEYEKAKLDWEKMNRMAKGVLEKDTAAYRDAIAHFMPFAEIKGLGSKVDFTIHTDHLVADLQVTGDDIVPNYTLSLTSTGKLSKKEMAVSKYNALYQDHICSSVLRLARETFALLPVPFILVNAIANVLNPSTGKIGAQTILSVFIPVEKLADLNFEALDPSDSMQNFRHNMHYSKTTGFGPVEKLEVAA